MHQPLCSLEQRRLAPTDGCAEAGVAAAGGFAGADAITSAAEEAALAAALGDAWLPNKGIQLLIRSIHSATGTPWCCSRTCPDTAARSASLHGAQLMHCTRCRWGSIAIATVAARAATLPLTLKQLRNTFNMRARRPSCAAVDDLGGLQARVGADVCARCRHRKPCRS